MANNRIVFAGLEEFKAQLRNLPAHLAKEAGGIVTGHAESAAAKVRAEYQRHRVTGNLADHVKVDRATVSGAGASARVRSTAKHATIFEFGTQARHTNIGANRGAMPPGNVFVPIVVRERRAMIEDLIVMVQGEGLKVTR